MKAYLLLSAVVVSSGLSLFGCSDGAVDGSGADGSGAGKSTGSASVAGLPCDVAEVVQANCASCHGDPPSSSAPQALLTPADFRAKSKSDPARSNGEVSIERMKLAGAPMPPGILLDAAAVAIMENWVNAGMPEGECNTMNVDDPVLNADPVCTSMDTWPAGEEDAAGKTRAEMLPGMPCIDCHVSPLKYGFDTTGPEFSIGGTVFPSGHEPDLCAGLDGTQISDVIVHIEDATGKTWDLHPNKAGNFFLEQIPVAMPYSAKVINQYGERVMSLKPDNGDCNLCHTQGGSSGPDPMGPTAPGRIVPAAPPQP